MNKQTLNTLVAIRNLVSSLKEVFGNNKPLCLYDRLLSKITPNDKVAAEAQFNIFKEFFNKHKACILNDEPFPPGTKIVLDKGGRIYIDISYMMNKLPPSDQSNIMQHLLTIYAFIEPKGKAMSRLEEVEKKVEDLDIDDSTNEGAFVKDLLLGAKEVVENAPPDNPTAAMASIFSSGLIPKMMSGLQGGVQGGQLDIGKMFATMSTVLGEISKEVGPQIEEVDENETKSDETKIEDKNDGTDENLLKEIEEEQSCIEEVD